MYDDYDLILNKGMFFLTVIQASLELSGNLRVRNVKLLYIYNGDWFSRPI